MFLRLKGVHFCFNHAYVQHEMAFFLQLGRCTFFFESLVVITASGLQAPWMDIHHNTSFRSILKDDSISSSSKACIHSCSSKGARLWLVVRSSIRSFHIAHSLFISTMHFHLGVIQPLAFSFFTCECGHGSDTFGTHLVRCPFGSQRIATHDTIQDVMYALVWKSWHAIWKKRW
jgi:hypothetical protein